jgi:hypothetical protein
VISFSQIKLGKNVRILQKIIYLYYIKLLISLVKKIELKIILLNKTLYRGEITPKGIAMMKTSSSTGFEIILLMKII